MGRRRGWQQLVEKGRKEGRWEAGGAGPTALGFCGEAWEGIKREGGEGGEHHSAPPIRITYMQRLGKRKGKARQGKARARGRQGN